MTTFVHIYIGIRWVLRLELLVLDKQKLMASYHGTQELYTGSEREFSQVGKKQFPLRYRLEPSNMSREIDPEGETGWSVDILQNPENVPVTLFCERVECKRVLKDPYQLPCGHKYCKACLDAIKSLPDTEILCHACLLDYQSEQMDITTSEQATIEHQISDEIKSKAKINFDSSFADTAAVKDLNKLSVKCLHGCGTKDLKYKDLEAHLKACTYRKVICVRCLAETEFRLLQQHQQNECLHRSVQCLYRCDTTGITAAQLYEHKAKCEKRPEVCRFCKNTILEETNYVHLQKCIGDCVYRLQKSDPNKLIIQHLNQKIVYYLLRIIHTFATICSDMSEAEARRGRSAMETDEQTDSSVIEQELSDISDEFINIEKNCDITRQSVTNSLGKLKEKREELLKSFELTREQKSIIDSLEKVIISLDTAVHLLDSYNLTYKEAEKRIRQQEDRKSEMIRLLERRALINTAMVTEQKLRLDEFAKASFDGHLLWKIENVMYLKESAVKGERYSMYSPPFYSSSQGYKMCLRLYLNGDGNGKQTHISLFFVVMRGEHDALLKWPFPHKVTMTLRNQTNRKPDIVERFRPEPSSSSFEKPKSERNIASGCPQFADQVEVYSQENGFLKDDVLFFDVTVDLTDAPDPPPGKLL